VTGWLSIIFAVNELWTEAEALGGETLVMRALWSAGPCRTADGQALVAAVLNTVAVVTTTSARQLDLNLAPALTPAVSRSVRTLIRILFTARRRYRARRRRVGKPLPVPGAIPTKRISNLADDITARLILCVGRRKVFRGIPRSVSIIFFTEQKSGKNVCANIGKQPLQD
jgi:hypothetical protein